MTTMRALPLALMLGAAMPAVADTPQPPANQPPADQPVAEKKVCRSIETTGSVMTHRVCRPKSEWAQIDKQNAKDAERFGTSTRNDLGGAPPR
jgi:hypothetical protein